MLLNTSKDLKTNRPAYVSLVLFWISEKLFEQYSGQENGNTPDGSQKSGYKEKLIKNILSFTFKINYSFFSSLLVCITVLLLFYQNKSSFFQFANMLEFRVFPQVISSNNFLFYFISILFIVLLLDFCLVLRATNSGIGIVWDLILKISLGVKNLYINFTGRIRRYKVNRKLILWDSFLVGLLISVGSLVYLIGNPSVTFLKEENIIWAFWYKALSYPLLLLLALPALVMILILVVLSSIISIPLFFIYFMRFVRLAFNILSDHSFFSAMKMKLSSRPQSAEEAMEVFKRFKSSYGKLLYAKVLKEWLPVSTKWAMVLEIANQQEGEVRDELLKLCETWQDLTLRN